MAFSVGRWASDRTCGPFGTWCRSSCSVLTSKSDCELLSADSESDVEREVLSLLPLPLSDGSALLDSEWVAPPMDTPTADEWALEHPLFGCAGAGTDCGLAAPPGSDAPRTPTMKSSSLAGAGRGRGGGAAGAAPGPSKIFFIVSAVQDLGSYEMALSAFE